MQRSGEGHTEVKDEVNSLLSLRQIVPFEDDSEFPPQLHTTALLTDTDTQSQIQLITSQGRINEIEISIQFVTTTWLPLDWR